MQLSRSLSLGLMASALLFSACSTESKKSRDNDPEDQAPSANPTLKCGYGQVLDLDGKSCRKPTERECIEGNMVFNGVTCDSYFPGLYSVPADAPSINLAAFCETNSKGAFINCKDGDFTLPVAAIAQGDGTDESFKNMAVDEEIKVQHSIKSVGAVKVMLDHGTEPLDLLKPADATIPWLIRNLNVGDVIKLKVSFAPDTVIHGKSEIRISEQFVTYHDKGKILEAIASKKVTNKWLADETERQRKARVYRSKLNDEWLAFLKNEVKGDVVWTLNEKCPADQKRAFLATSVCLIDQKVESIAAWQNRAFIYTCTTTRTISIDYAQERYGLLSYGKFQDEPFSILIPKNTPFIGPDCFIKIIE